MDILGETFPAFLDGGSGCSTAGKEIIELVQKKNLKIHPSDLTITFYYGSYKAKEKVFLTIKHAYGSKRQTLYLTPNAPHPLTLGRDFLITEDMTILYSRGGYALGTDMSTKLPFVSIKELDFRSLRRKENHSASSVRPNVITGDSLDSDDETKRECLYYMTDPNLGLEPDDEPCGPQDPALYEPLYATKCDHITIHKDLLENRKEKLRKTLEPFLDIISPIPGNCSLYLHTINLVDSVNLSCLTYKAAYAPMSKGKMEVFDQTFDELLRLGIIHPSASPWTSTAFVLPKKGWKLAIYSRL